MNNSSARIGYGRVSTADQNLDAQMAALEAAGCTMVRTETGDGATIEAFELHDEQWLLIASAKDDELISNRTFDALAFSLGDLWP